MKIEDKVVSLELAKKMKELGWNYKTEKYWVEETETILAPHTATISPTQSGRFNLEYYPSHNTLLEHFSAPDAIEITEKLPYKIESEYYLTICKCRIGYIVRYWDYEHKQLHRTGNVTQSYKGNLADCLGDMWCFLRERKLIYYSIEGKINEYL